MTTSLLKSLQIASNRQRSARRIACPTAPILGEFRAFSAFPSASLSLSLYVLCALRKPVIRRGQGGEVWRLVAHEGVSYSNTYKPPELGFGPCPVQIYDLQARMQCVPG